jgi:hypothetical protein
MSVYKIKYWKDETIIKELKEIIQKIGHFPLYREIKSDLIHAIQNHGNINKYRLILGYKPIKQSRGYWTEENTIKELKLICEKLNHFPTFGELMKIKRSDLTNVMKNTGGIPKYRKLCGFSDNFYSNMMSYNTQKGYKTEKIIKNIIRDYCLIHNLSEPKYNVRLAKGNIIEFVCNTNKTIGIDVTNTKDNYNCVSEKWHKKDYHKHLDELWVVVFSNSFSEKDYIIWNNNSPSNVKIFSIYDFLKELDYSVSESLKTKIDKYTQCTFHTKEQLKEMKL